MSGGKWVKVASTDEVPEKCTLLVTVAEQPVALYNVGGRYFATHDLCTHGQASLSFGDIQGENIECPLHQGSFHIPTGKAVAAPCAEDLRTYPVKVVDGFIYVLSD